MVRRLLVPVDGSELMARAVEESISLARQLRVGITGFVVEVPLAAPSSGLLSEHRKIAAKVYKARASEHARSVLDRFEARAREADIDFNGEFAEANDVVEAIVRAAEQYGCDLILMAAHDRGFLDGLLSYSHSRNVIAKSRVPVVVVH